MRDCKYTGSPRHRVYVGITEGGNIGIGTDPDWDSYHALSSLGSALTADEAKELAGILLEFAEMGRFM